MDRVKVWGTLAHFAPFTEETKCSIKVKRDQTTGRWKMDEPVLVETSSGFRFTISQVNEGIDQDPKNINQLRFTVKYDKTTFASGMQNMPDRLDLRIEPPNQSGGWSPGFSVPRILDGSTSAIWTLKADQIKPEVEMRISVNRRTIDRELPFSLILPLDKSNLGRWEQAPRPSSP